MFGVAAGHVLWTNNVTLELLGYESHEFIGTQPPCFIIYLFLVTILVQCIGPRSNSKDRVI